MPISSVTIDAALNMLRQLPPRERLKVISIVLPETEQELPMPEPTLRKSLRGLWKDLNVNLSAEDIDEARRECWKNFPREDIV